MKPDTVQARPGSHLFAIEVHVSAKRSSGTSEREHGEGDRDGDVNSNLTHVNLGLELPGSGSRSCEDGSTVAIGITVDNINSLRNKVLPHSQQ